MIAQRLVNSQRNSTEVIPRFFTFYHKGLSMLYDTRRNLVEPTRYTVSEFRPMSAHMDVMRTHRLKESSLPLLICIDDMEFDALVFEPIQGFYYGSCGPTLIPRHFGSVFYCDRPLLMFILILDGTYGIDFGKDRHHSLQLGKNTFLVGDWHEQWGHTVIPAQRAYSHIAFAVDRGAIGANFGESVENELLLTLHPTLQNTAYNVPTISGLASPDLVSAGKRLQHIVGTGTYNRLSCIDTMELRAASLDFFARILRNAATPSSRPLMIIHDQDSRSLTRLKEDIERDCLVDLNVRELCTSIGMSESKANKAFKQLFNVTIAKHVHNCRMNHAHAMLIRREKNVSECAFEVGYTNIGHFIAAFKKHYGMTPGDAIRHSS